MGLIHWWPLNGDTKDYGLNTADGTLIGTANVTAAGKIGKCLSAGNGSQITAGISVPTNLVDELTGKDYTFAVWVKPLGQHVHYNGTIISSGNWNSKSWAFGISQANNQIDMATNGYNKWISYTFTVGQWYHIVSVQKGTTNTVYVNGVLVGSSTQTAIYQSDATNLCIGRETYANGYFSFNGNINDVRIYDHALSVKEIKELSKGLVLHYNFEDEYIEPTTNLITQLVSGGRTSVSDNAIVTTGENGDTYFYLKFPTALVQGTTYTISCDAEIPTGGTGTQWKFGMGSQSTSDPNFIINNGHNEYTFVCTANSAKQQLLFDDMSRIYGVSSRFYNFQVEQKDHATPYVNGARSAGKVYDNSGYGYNGTNNGVILSNNSSSGRFSAKFESNAYIEIPTLPQFDKVTYSMWVKIPANTGSYRSIFIPKGSPTAGGVWMSVNTEGVNLWTYQGGNSPNYCKGTSTLLSADTWYLYTYTFNGTTGQNYLNGVAVGNAATYTTRTYIPSGIYTLGDSYTGTSWSGTPFDGQIADFKIFATVLSAEDILAEYNRKAAIDKNGNLFTGEIIETNGSVTKIDKNNFVASNLFATTMTLDDGSIWAPICIHYIPDGLFTSANQTLCYTGRNIWTNFGAISDLERPESGQWEFYVMQQSTVGGTFSRYRFKQNVNPMSATWDQVNPSKVGTNVTRISGTSTNNYAGMYWYNASNMAMCFANTSNGNWFGCGARAYWGTGYTPGYNGEQVRGWQLVYMRISKHKARLFKNGVIIPTDIVEN